MTPEERDVMRLEAYGEGYSDGIKAINEVYDNAQKQILDRLYFALGRQGGTIHQIANVLFAAESLARTHSECEIDNDWDRFKASVVRLKAVLNE